MIPTADEVAAAIVGNTNFLHLIWRVEGMGLP
jgi:hypothetical protein